MQKTLVISLSSILFTLPLMADATLTDQKGFLVTKECLLKGEFNDCPLEQLTKISATNPLMLFQGAEDKAYILDLSSMDKVAVGKLGMQNDIIVSGILQSDQKTLKVQKIEKYVVQKDVWKGRM
jgi:hypothetical protein